MSTDENNLCIHSHGRQHRAHCITFGDAENGMDSNQRRRRRKKNWLLYTISKYEREAWLIRLNENYPHVCVMPLCRSKALS